MGSRFSDIQQKAVQGMRLVPTVLCDPFIPTIKHQDLLDSYGEDLPSPLTLDLNLTCGNISGSHSHPILSCLTHHPKPCCLLERACGQMSIPFSVSFVPSQLLVVSVSGVLVSSSIQNISPLYNGTRKTQWTSINAHLVWNGAQLR